MSYIDGLNTSNQLLMVKQMTLSIDKKYVYFLTNKYVTDYQLVKVNIRTGKWHELFPSNYFQYLINGSFKGMFFITTSEIRSNGREEICMIVDEKGQIIKDFKDYKTALIFLNSIK